MSINKYYPILKTTISELRALKQVDCSSRSPVTPIFELTKARKSKKDEMGNVYKRINEIKDIVKDSSFFLDLTSEESLTNPQIESMFDDNNNFENWREFISSLRNDNLNVIPIIQAYDDNTIQELTNQVVSLSKVCEEIAIRIKPSYFNETIAESLLTAAHDFNFYTIIDLEYVDIENKEETKFNVCNFISKCFNNNLSLGKVIICSSSFPPMVKHNNKDSGSFFNYEKTVHSDISELFPKENFAYGDYGSVHPFRNDIKAYNWVPRIDYSLNNKTIFYRMKRDNGGYKNCADRLVLNSDYITNEISCWGGDEIITASTKEPNGKSPSYWISVRINIHIHRILNWLTKY